MFFLLINYNDKFRQQDIARYDYDYLNMQAIGLLDRQYRVYEALFLRAEKAVVRIRSSEGYGWKFIPLSLSSHLGYA